MSVVLFVEKLLRDMLEIPSTMKLGIKRTHQALAQNLLTRKTSPGQ